MVLTDATCNFIVVTVTKFALGDMTEINIMILKILFSDMKLQYDVYALKRYPMEFS